MLLSEVMRHIISVENVAREYAWISDIKLTKHVKNWRCHLIFFLLLLLLFIYFWMLLIICISNLCCLARTRLNFGKNLTKFADGWCPIPITDYIFTLSEREKKYIKEFGIKFQFRIAILWCHCDTIAIRWMAWFVIHYWDAWTHKHKHKIKMKKKKIYNIVNQYDSFKSSFYFEKRCVNHNIVATK